MAHEHSVTDSDKRFTIDELMKISNVDEVKALRRGDHAAERYGFTMPRYIEGHDMSLCNVVEVHFDNIHKDTATRETVIKSSFDTVDDFAVAADDENTVNFSWLIKGDATQLDGTLNFCIRFACINDEGIVEYQKSTEKFVGVPVGESIYNSKQIEKAFPDVIASHGQRIAELEKNGGGSVSEEEIAEAVNKALEEAKASGDFNGEDGKDGANGVDGKDGADGKTAFEYAVEGGYLGAESQFGADLNEVLSVSKDLNTILATLSNGGC